MERNPFGLKDPPPPAEPKSEAPIVPPAKVLLTGITSLFGPTRAFLEITEQEPGKPATVKRPILRVGEREGSVEVVSIDPVKYMVHIRNGGQEIDVKFEDPSKTAGIAPRPVVPGMPSVPPPAPLPTVMPTAMSAPTIISPASAEHSTRGSSVSMMGGQSAIAENPAPNQNATYNNMAMNNGGAPIITGRDLRTPPADQQPIDPAAQYIGMLAHEQAVKQQDPNKPFPPVPPMPTDHGNMGNQNVPKFPVPPTPGAH
ncbi:MAG: hypothetical protein JWM16_2096 [Verrucomicrobiales bacterium]|nr:hypothetical protein [Verrucomicrobiales bacterium]